MFRTSRRKIVAAIMSILVVLWISTLAVIYGSSYITMNRENSELLRMHADMYQLDEGRPDDKMPPDGGKL